MTKLQKPRIAGVSASRHPQSPFPWRIQGYATDMAVGDQMCLEMKDFILILPKSDHFYLNFASILSDFRLNLIKFAQN